MTEREYQEIQERLSNKLKNHPYDLSYKKSQAYEEGIKSAMSIVKSVYERNKT